MFKQKKIIKNNKTSIFFKGYATTDNVEILNSFNHDLQIKDSDSAVRRRSMVFLTQLKCFKFVITIVLVFQKIESEYKTKHYNFIHAQKQK